MNGFPAFTSSPKSATVFVGMKISFTGAATGAEPLNYHWKKGGIDLAGANGASLTLNQIQLGDAGSYSLVASNSYGAVTSAPAVLTVLTNTFKLPPPGTVVGLGGPVVPDGLTDAVAIAAGYGQLVAVRSNGTVVCWGDTHWPHAPAPAGLSNLVAVSSGFLHSIALHSDGTVVGWGHNAAPPAGLFGVVAIASGHDHSIALKADGTTVSWGAAIAPPPGNSNYAAVSAGLNFNLELRNDGTIPPPEGCCTLYGFPGASNVVGIAGAGFNAFVMLRSDGTVQGWNASVPAGLSNVVAVSSGLALKNDGTVVGLGAAAPAGLTNVVAIAGSVAGGLAITTNPPPPVLSAASSGDSFMLSTPLSVPGYVLEAADNFAGPYTIVEAYTNATTTDGLMLPISGPKQYFRLRKQ